MSMESARIGDVLTGHSRWKSRVTECSAALKADWLSPTASLVRRLPIGSRTFARLTWRCWMRAGSRPRTTALGPVMNLDPGNAYQRELVFGIYERAEVNVLLSVLAKDSLFIDVGANIGYYSLIAAQVQERGGSVIAFEPDPSNLSRFHDNIRLNRCERRVSVRSYALAANAGRCVLISGEHSVGSTLETKERDVARLGPEFVGRHKRALEVSTSTLDQQCHETLERWNGIKVLKMDIEGVEPLALQGSQGSLDHIDCALIEQNPMMLRLHGFAVSAIQDRMSRCGFRCALVREHLGQPRLLCLEESGGHSGNLLFYRSSVESRLRPFLRVTG